MQDEKMQKISIKKCRKGVEQIQKKYKKFSEKVQ